MGGEFVWRLNVNLLPQSIKHEISAAFVCQRFTGAQLSVALDRNFADLIGVSEDEPEPPTASV